jgi:hypothetical protein
VHTDEGDDDMPAHVKSSMFGASVTLPVTNGRLNLGTWQVPCSFCWKSRRLCWARSDAAGIGRLPLCPFSCVSKSCQLLSVRATF